jgi:hypothetical protein
VDDVAQVFLGMRINCAQCHHHPYEKWSQDDYWGLAAFFGRVGRKPVSLLGVQGAESEPDPHRRLQSHNRHCHQQAHRPAPQ